MFGEHLAALRRSRNMSQQELGGLLGVSQEMIAKYEGDKAYPTVPGLVRIADYFQVTTDWLLGRNAVAPEHIAPEDILIRDRDLEREINNYREYLQQKYRKTRTAT